MGDQIDNKKMIDGMADEIEFLKRALEEIAKQRTDTYARDIAINALEVWKNWYSKESK